MELSLHNALCKEIQTLRIDDDTPSADDHDRTASCNWLRHSRSPRMHTFSARTGTLDAAPADRKAHLPRRTQRKRIVKQRSSSLYVRGTDRPRVNPMAMDDNDDDDGVQATDKAVMTGWLYKTSRLKTSKTRGHRQHRKFKLTPHSLEYSNLLQKVKVQKRFPLTSIVDIIYDEIDNPMEFKLIFQNSEVVLEAHDHGSCKQWVENIKKAWKQWNVVCKQGGLADSSANGIEEVTEDINDPEAVAFLKKNQDYIEAAKRNLECATPGLVTSPDVARQYFDNTSVNNKTNPRRNALRRLRTRVGLAPRVQERDWKFYSGSEAGDNSNFVLLSKSGFAMIKYPRKGHSIPHERVFQMDLENLLIMWHKSDNARFSYMQTLMTEHVVDVREGQNSDGFDRYPYEEMEKQSLSIIVEGEKRTVPGGRRYAVLQSLDLICDTPREHQLWYHALKLLISPKHQLYSSRYKSTDPTIMWLITHWSTLADEGEVKEDTALCFGYKLTPHFAHNKIQQLLSRAHQCQLKESEHHGRSLHWDGFICFFSLLCEIDKSNSLLMEIFKEYAVKHPSLGMTVEEFQQFLIEYQQWSPEDATDEKCVQLMLRYDYHYRAYKMHKANSTPFEFNISLCLLSFGGFLSFLRSPENSAIDIKHEEIYQDMTQPLSHYFINSSHNTYLEGHQLTGRSTTDAYVRALLQGCRCLELDCWDGPDGEPRITHGNTLVSDLPLEEVAKTIDKYAFCTSTYPVILSLENHCSPDQQGRMAEIFTRVFGEKLAKENLTETYNLDRLPSPHQLQRKIILKGTDKSSIKTLRKSPFVILRKRSSIPVPPIISPSRSKERKSSQVSIADATVNSFHSVVEDEESNKRDDFSKSIEDNSSQQEEGGDEDDDTEENDLSEKLSDLIVYCRSKRIRPWSWDAQKETSVCNMFSFSESAALARCKDSSEMVACTERQFVRTYPGGTRIDSSNYDPIPLWNHGIQMVALNVQTPDLSMYLNQGKFRQNGGCGYILKPKIMRNAFKPDYTPNTNEPLKGISPVNLEITPLSGQHLIVPPKRTVSMEILYQTYGIPHDCEKKKVVVYTQDTNPLCPQFHSALTLEKTIHMPELCLVLFAVYIRVSRKLQAGTKQILLGQNVFPLESLKPGLHFVPLRTPGGKSASHIGIFVKIAMNKLSQKQASSSGICSLQDVKSPSEKLSSSRLFETCKFSLEEIKEDTNSVAEDELRIEEEKSTNACSISKDTTDTDSADLVQSKSRLVRQEAIVQFTVELCSSSSNNTM